MIYFRLTFEIEFTKFIYISNVIKCTRSFAAFRDSCRIVCTTFCINASRWVYRDNDDSDDSVVCMVARDAATIKYCYSRPCFSLEECERVYFRRGALISESSQL